MYARVIGMRLATTTSSWYADKVAQVKQARTLAAAQQKALTAQQNQGQ